MNAFDVSGLILSLLLLAPATYWDIKEKRVPNFIVFPGMAVGLSLLVLKCIYDGSILSGIENLGLFVLLFLFGMTGLLGLGDIKLLMALSLVNDPVTLLLSIALACLLIVFVQIVKQGRKIIAKLWAGFGMILTKKLTPVARNADTVPFVPYFLITFLVTFLTETAIIWLRRY